MATVPDLLRDIDRYLAETGHAETTFGRLAVNDGKFVKRLRLGKGVTVTTVERVRSYIAEQRAVTSMKQGGDAVEGANATASAIPVGGDPA